MLLALIASVLAAAAGVLRGGSLERLASVNFRWGPLLLGALVAQVAVDLFFPADTPRWLVLAALLATYALVVAVLIANRHQPGMGWAAAGLALNVIAIAANGAMPISPRAAEIAGANIGFLGTKHELLGPHTLLPWLTDVIPVPVLGQVFSIGDVVLTVGLVRFVYSATIGSEPRRAAG